MDKRRATFTVYDPPKPGFPFLAVVLLEGESEVTVVACRTYEEADACIQEMAEKFADFVSKDPGDA